MLCSESDQLHIHLMMVLAGSRLFLVITFAYSSVVVQYVGAYDVIHTFSDHCQNRVTRVSRVWLIYQHCPPKIFQLG